MITFFWIAIIISIIGLIIATYTDIKERIVPNKLNYGLALIGLILFGIQSILEGTIEPITYSILGIIFGFIFGWILWKVGVFAGGDVKLFMGLGALNQFTPAILKTGLFANTNTPIFPITLFIYSLMAFLPYGIFVITYKIAKNKKFQKELYQEAKPMIILAIHASLFAAATYTILFFFGISTYLTIIPLTIWGLLKKEKKYVSAVALIIAAYVNLTLLAQAIITAIFTSVLIYTTLKILFSARKVLVDTVEVKDLTEGMIPAKSLYWKGKKVEEEQNLNLRFIINCIKNQNSEALMNFFTNKKEIISSRKARGLNDEEIDVLKKLRKKGLIGSTIAVKESMPFVPTMLLGYLLCLIFGDFVINMFLGMI